MSLNKRPSQGLDLNAIGDTASDKLADLKSTLAPMGKEALEAGKEQVMEMGKQAKESIDQATDLFKSILERFKNMDPEEKAALLKQTGIAAGAMSLALMAKKMEKEAGPEKPQGVKTNSKAQEPLPAIEFAKPEEGVIAEQEVENAPVEQSNELPLVPEEQILKVIAFEEAITSTESRGYAAPHTLVQFDAMSTEKQDTLGLPDAYQAHEANYLFREGFPSDAESFKALLEKEGITTEMIASSALGSKQIIPKYHFDKIGLDPNSYVDQFTFLSSPGLQNQLMRTLTLEYGEALDWNYEAMMVAHYGGLGRAKEYKKDPTLSAYKKKAPHGYSSIEEYVKKTSKTMASNLEELERPAA